MTTPGDILEKILSDGDAGSLRWDVSVPVVTNPFILVDFLRFIIVTGMIIFVVAAIPQWFYTRDLSPPRVLAILRLCATGCALFAALLFAAGFLLLRNRFHARYVLNSQHIYYENSRIGGDRAFARETPWSRVDGFISFPRARAILLKRGMWEILKLYTPDAVTHSQAEAFLSQRLKKLRP